MIAQFKARRNGLILAPAPKPAPTDTAVQHHRPTVCVVIPARNEASGLAACLRSVLAQDYPELSVVLVDDRSDDETAGVATEFARADARVRVERVAELPSGWMAKSHALWRATRSVAAEWLLFIDVDCRLEPRAVTTAVEEARRRGVEFLTLWPRQAAGGFWEHLTIPLCAGIIALWYGSQAVNDSQRGSAFANGQFLLIARWAYERIGGHRAVRSALIEDIPLAERAQASGLACWVASGRELVTVRMYESYRAILNGWARIYVGALRNGTRIILSILWLIGGSLLPYVAAVILAVWLATADGDRRPTSVACLTMVGLCVLHLLLMLIASYRFWGMGGCRRGYLVLYPLSVLVVIRILARSWWWLTVCRSVPWRNTRYTIDRAARIVD